ncbi:hypothetical protein Acr_00g0012940 [Actinidia rufa]|uniref:Uncharacterized protein n=1 Tax=Actinidia rufa TaxID=165716 RepID=A0A7J0D9V9_9ERIC|nr:hypothetical protein Acr_00g0012940 [Actinidia rufa]
MSTMGQTESSYSGMAVDIIKTQRSSGEDGDLEDFTARITCTAVKEQLCEGLSGIMSNYSLDCGSEYNSVLLKDNKKTAARSMEFASMEDSLKVCGDTDGKSYNDICIQHLQGPNVIACSHPSEALDHGETDSKYSVSFHHSNPLDYCGLQCDTDILESKMSDKLLDQPPSEPSKGFELAGDNFVDLMTILTPNKDVQLTDTYSAEELDCYGQIGDPEKILSSEDIQSKYRGADAIQPSDASSFRLRQCSYYSLSEDSWKGDMLPETMDPATDKLETGHNYVAKNLKEESK